MNKIDIHLHVALEKMNLNPEIVVDNSDVMKEHLLSIGIDQGVALSSGENTKGKMNNEEVRKISEKHPDFFHWMANFDYVDIDTVYDRLKKYKEQGAIGVGELTINKPINDPFIQEIFASAEKLDMPLLFHMSPAEGYNYGIVDGAGMPQLEASLKKFPNLIVVGHSQPFWQEISGDMDTSNESRNSWGEGPVTEGGKLPYMLDKYPNLYCDLSANSGGQAIMRDEEFGLAFLEKYQDRLMFGTDMVNKGMNFPLSNWLDDKHKEGKLSDSAYKKICRENAKKVFKI